MPILYKSKGRRKYPRLRKTIYFIPPALVLASYFCFPGSVCLSLYPV